MKITFNKDELAKISFEQRAAFAVQYCAMISGPADVRNDAANIFSINYDDYNAIWRVLDFQ